MGLLNEFKVIFFLFLFYLRFKRVAWFYYIINKINTKKTYSQLSNITFISLSSSFLLLSLYIHTKNFPEINEWPFICKRKTKDAVHRMFIYCLTCSLWGRSVFNSLIVYTFYSLLISSYSSVSFLLNCIWTFGQILRRISCLFVFFMFYCFVITVSTEKYSLTQAEANGARMHNF